ncbi:hypothetical protein ABZ023_34545 [Streptomyces sp. NPDC006367]
MTRTDVEDVGHGLAAGGEVVVRRLHPLLDDVAVHDPQSMAGYGR